MADDITLNAGSGGSVVAADNISSVFYPRSKIVIGADGVNDGDVCATNPIPVTGTVAVSGTVTVGSHAVTNAGTFAVQATCTNAGTFATQSVCTNSGTFAVQVSSALPAGTNAIGKLAANDGVDIGDVTLNNTSIAVTNSGTFAVQLTSTTITGTVAVTQSGTWDEVGINDSGNSITVDNGGTFAVQATCTNAGTFAVQAVCTNAGTFAVQATCTNAGTFAVQVDGSALTSLQLIDDTVFVDDAAFTPATSKVLAIGLQADEASIDSVDEGDIGCPRMTLDRKVLVTPQPHTAGGLSISRDIDLDNGTLTVVKNAAGQLYGWDITNLTTATLFVKFYDAASGTLGTGTPVMTIAIPGNATDSTMSSKSFGGMGLVFATGICVGAGTAVADNDNTDPGANKCVANIYYK